MSGLPLASRKMASVVNCAAKNRPSSGSFWIAFLIDITLVRSWYAGVISEPRLTHGMLKQLITGTYSSVETSMNRKYSVSVQPRPTANISGSPMPARTPPTRM